MKIVHINPTTHQLNITIPINNAPIEYLLEKGIINHPFKCFETNETVCEQDPQGMFMECWEFNNDEIVINVDKLRQAKINDLNQIVTNITELLKQKQLTLIEQEQFDEVVTINKCITSMKTIDYNSHIQDMDVESIKTYIPQQILDCVSILN